MISATRTTSATRRLRTPTTSIRGVRYRVSNHTVEASNRAAYRRDGTRRRELYHPDGREEGTVYIHASHFRLPQIYMDLRMGRKLDGRGRGKPRERVVRCRGRTDH